MQPGRTAAKEAAPVTDRIVNIDGNLYAPEEARVSVFDHGFLFGDSIYETMRTYDRRIFLLERHMQRLQNSAHMLRLVLPLPVDRLQDELRRTVEATTGRECYVRLIVTRGKGRIGLDIAFSDRPSYVIIVQPFAPVPAEYYEKGIKVSMVSVRRNDPQTVNPRVKSCNLLNNVLAYMQAKDHDAFEGILCNVWGYVAEATGSNVFVVKDGAMLTPALAAGLLPGITRSLALELATGIGISCSEQNITPAEFVEADECFITGTTKGILPVGRIDERILSPVPGPVTRRMMDAYRDFVRERY
jgi:branched-chain amino acid aminotransferase